MPVDRLATSVTGTGARLVLVHGFTQTGRSWKVVADALSSHFEVMAVDAPGHGDSGTVRSDLPQAAQLLGDTGGRATYIGYSMGGRMCLRLALDRPDLVERLVLISTTAGIDDPMERRARRDNDEALAGSIGRDGRDAFLMRWVARPMFAGIPDPDLQDRRRNTVDGLASSLLLAGTGSEEPLWDRLGQLEVPVLLVAGSQDAKFVALAERMAAAIIGADLAVVEGAGHAVHLERPDQFLQVVESWLSR